MTKKRLHEAGAITFDADALKFRVCLISEGKGSSASFAREFFTTENAEALAESLSFPGHPERLWQPENRDPLSAIATIGETVTIEEHDGRMGFWSTYKVAESRPDVAVYLKEFAKKLGLSIYIDADGYEDTVTGRWFATKLDADDPYKSVDLVVAAGAGGKFDRVAESALRRITEASATAGEKEVSQMEIKELAENFDKKFTDLTKVIEGLASTLEGKAKAVAQVEVDTAAVEKAVESRLGDYDKAVVLINEAKLTESQSAELRALALKGEDVAPGIEKAKKFLAEAREGLAEGDETKDKKIAEHLGGGDKSEAFDPMVPGFGKVS